MSSDLKAVLDIGSNTIRLLIAKVHHQGVERVFYQHHIVRLGEGLQQSGMLGESGMDRALAAFHVMIDDCARFGVSAPKITAVATAAVREATNGQDFVARVASETGLEIQIISGEEEATLALQGAMYGLPANVASEMLLIDIGGGSTEFSRVAAGELMDSLSLKLGVVRLTELYPMANPPADEDYQKLKSQASVFLDELTHLWQTPKLTPKHLVGTAGTVTTIAAIAQELAVYEASRINGYALSKTHFCRIRDMLLQMTSRQRLEIPALEKGREDVIVAGLAILEAMFERWGYTELIAVDSGLLEGLLHFENGS